MRLNYHSWKMYRECPKHFNLKHLLKKPPTMQENKYYTLYGKLVEKFFQFFSNDWSKDNPNLSPEEVREKLSFIYPNILTITPVDWGSYIVKQSKEEIFEEALRDINIILQSPNKDYFINSLSEWSISVSTKTGDELTGRLDFFHKDQSKDMILDGKGTRKIGKNINKDQLLFYALLYALHTKKLPGSLGFFYYRLNLFTPVELNANILNSFRAQISLDLKKINEDKKFTATPSNKSCQYCEYQNTCAEVHVPKHRDKISYIPETVSSKTGIQEFGF